MRRSIINIPYENSLHRKIQVPLNQTEQLKKSNAIQKYDLIWMSDNENPFINNSNYYCSDTNTLKIPSTLALVSDIYYDDRDCIWVLLVNDRILFNSIPSLVSTVSVHITDVVANHTEYLRKTKAAVMIQKHYKRHYFTRNLMAKRIQRAYIRHYWNPRNPNMIKRLTNDYQQLCMNNY